jgi:rhamnosyltransferase
MSFSDFLKEILFVVVLYRKKPEESPTLRFIATLSEKFPQSISVFIYDNSPEASIIDCSNAIYRHDPSNSGVSKAYNESSKVAVKQNRRWLLLLDQDTEAKVALIEQFHAAIGEYKYSVAFVPMLRDSEGILSPFRWSIGKGKRITAMEKTLLLNKYRFANSGLLIQTKAFMDAGGYEESICLDFSDIAFGEKLKTVTNHFVVINLDIGHHFSGSARASAHEAVSRFKYFCSGALSMGKIFGSRYIYIARVFMRAMKLTMTYRKTFFLQTFLNCVKNY